MQASAAILMAAALVVIAAGVIALLMLIRARLRRDFPKRPRRSSADSPDPWAEAGRRLDPPPPDDPEEDRDDDDDDGPGDPTAPVPCNPSLAAQV